MKQSPKTADDQAFRLVIRRERMRGIEPPYSAWEADRECSVGPASRLSHQLDGRFLGYREALCTTLLHLVLGTF